MNTTEQAAVAAPVERGVRPCAWTARSWLQNRHGGHFVPERSQAFDVPLYDQAAMDAAVAAERDRWRELIDVEREEAAREGCPEAAHWLANLARRLKA